MRAQRHGFLFIIAALVGTLLTGANALAANASTRPGGTVHVFVYGDGEGTGSNIVLTGAIGDEGFSDSIDANGTPDPVNNTEVAIGLVRGGFRINVQQVNKAVGNQFNSFRPNANTCSGAVSATVDGVPIVTGSGYGQYSAISGSFNLTLTFAEIGVKYSSGKHKGQCNNSNNAPTIGSAMMVTGSGNVSFG